MAAAVASPPATTVPPAAGGDATAAPAASTPPASAPQSSLYVGDLDRDVTEAQMFDVFSQIGPVASIRVCRDAITRRSLGYAYVNYNTQLDPAAAGRAIDQLNFQPLQGKPMRLMWSHRDPAFRKSGVGNIFIKNLDKTIDNKALHDTFSAFGNILSCKVAADLAGESKGYGFVHFEREDSAQLAISKVNGMLLEGKKVFVGKFQKSDDRPADKELRYTNIYVKNLADTVTENDLTELFGKFGQVTSAVIMKDEEGKSRGFGFVNFEEAEGAHKAVEELAGKDLQGKELYVGRAQKKQEREQELRAKFDALREDRIVKYQGLNLYVKNLVDEVTDEQLRAEFAPHGTITSAKVMKDAAGKSKGFGFVCFANQDEAARAVAEVHNRMLLGKPMYVAQAQRREVRRAQLEQQYLARAPIPNAAGRLGPGGPQGISPNQMAPNMFPQQGGGFPSQYYPGQVPSQRPNMGNMGYAPLMNPQGMGPRGGPGGRGGRGNFGPGPQPYGPGPGAMGFGGPGPGPMRGGRGPRGGRGGPRPGGPMRAPDGYDMRPNGMTNGFGGPYGGYAQPVQPRGPAARPRAPPPPPAAIQPSQPPPPTAVVPGQEGGNLTTAMLAAAPPEQQKQMLGERLFPQVSQLQPDLAGKITGMLLEMDNSELLLLLESQDALEAKIEEALAVLKQHNAIPETKEA